MRVRKIIDELYSNYLLESDTTEDRLLTIYNIVISEFATDYFPLYTKEYFSKSKVLYSELTYNAVTIRSADALFKVTPQYLISRDQNKILGNIEYSYIPVPAESLESDCPYKEDKLQAIVYSILSEYYCQQGDFELSFIFNKAFKNELKGLT